MEYLVYIGKVSVYWILFLLFYQLRLRQFTFFKWNRAYLLATLMGSFILPFIKFKFPSPTLSATYTANIEPVLIQIQQNRTQELETSQILVSIYLIGVVCMTYRLFSRLRTLSVILRQGERIPLDSSTLILYPNNSIGSFSFFRWIVINQNDYNNHFDTVLSHEMVHAKQLHSLDIILTEVLQIILWFNPLILIYKKNFQELHEFLADAQASNRQAYALLLLQHTSPQTQFSLTHSFFSPSFTKTRIKMIFKNRTSKWALSSYLSGMATVMITGLFISNFSGTNPVQAQTKVAPQEKVNLQAKKSTSEKVYTVVEQQPEFPGGVKEMYKFLEEHIKYPSEAAKNNIEGRVFLSFIVDSDGSTRDIQVMQGPGHGLDEEALRVVSLFPKWNPGMQSGEPVNVKYNLPIHFALKSKKK